MTAARRLAAIIAVVLSGTAIGAEERDWTDLSGRKMKATFVRLDDTNAIFLKQGKEVSVPISKLSAEDRDLVVKLDAEKSETSTSNPFGDKNKSESSSSTSKTTKPKTDEPERRLWTDNQGKKINAKFVRMNGTNVVLNRGGKNVNVPYFNLSTFDQEYVASWLTEHGQENQIPKQPPPATKASTSGTSGTSGASGPAGGMMGGMSSMMPGGMPSMMPGGMSGMPGMSGGMPGMPGGMPGMPGGMPSMMPGMPGMPSDLGSGPPTSMPGGMGMMPTMPNMPGMAGGSGGASMPEMMPGMMPSMGSMSTSGDSSSFPSSTPGSSSFSSMPSGPPNMGPPAAPMAPTFQAPDIQVPHFENVLQCSGCRKTFTESEISGLKYCPSCGIAWENRGGVPRFSFSGRGIAGLIRLGCGLCALIGSIVGGAIYRNRK